LQKNEEIYKSSTNKQLNETSTKQENKFEREKVPEMEEEWKEREEGEEAKEQ
jgi:hypothetical protein